MALKLMAKSVNGVADITMKLLTPTPITKKTDTNGVAYFLIPKPVANQYDLEITDEQNNYYEKKVKLDLVGSLPNH